MEDGALSGVDDERPHRRSRRRFDPESKGSNSQAHLLATESPLSLSSKNTPFLFPPSPSWKVYKTPLPPPSHPLFSPYPNNLNSPYLTLPHTNKQPKTKINMSPNTKTQTTQRNIIGGSGGGWCVVPRNIIGGSGGGWCVIQRNISGGSYGGWCVIQRNA